MLGRMNKPVPIPLVPDKAARRDAAVASLVRACIAVGMGAVDPGKSATEHLKGMASDTTAGYLVRAASTPASLTTSTAVTRTIIADFLAALGPQSAGAQLLQRALQFSFDGNAAISLPGFVADTNSVAFVADGAPIPVRQFAVSTPVPQLVPRKMAVMSSLTNEMLASSNAEKFVRDVLLRDAALGLDRFLFDSTAGDATRPAGLRYGIAASTASNATDFHEAMVADIATLAAVVAQVGSDIVLVVSPARAILTQLRAQGATLPPVLGSAGINATDMIAIAVDALASATDEAPSIEASREAASIHMDTAPAEIVSTPGVVAFPVASVFQTDRTVLKLRFNADWVLRDSRAVAWLTTKW
jgi:hypothetical protein